MSKKRSEWNRFRQRLVTSAIEHRKRSIIPIKTAQEVIDITEINRKHRISEEEAMRKEQEIRNSSAPPSVTERHYPQSFRAPFKPEGEE